MSEKTEVIFRWHRGESIRSVARSLAMARKTIRKYIQIAQSAGVSLDKPLPGDEELAALFNNLKPQSWPTPAQDLLIPFDEQLSQWAKDPEVTTIQMYRLFTEAHPEVYVGKTAFKAYIEKHHRPRKVSCTVRIQAPPGQAQVDFGYVGKMFDPIAGKARKAWAFVMTLSQSRHRFVRFVFNQSTETWIDCHVRAFAFFGGVPRTIILDNLKAGIVKPDIYDPTFNKSYQECERHYGFVADPAKVRTPQHKGRVERSIPAVRKHLLAGRYFKDINAANQRALAWCKEEVGMIPHGTTKEEPVLRFEHTDKPGLLPLPTEPFEMPHWQRAKVSRDHHVVFRGAYYSVPTRFLGVEVDVRGTLNQVHIFHKGERIKTHVPTAKGTFQTDPHDYPEKQQFYLLNDRQACFQQAQEIGVATAEVMANLLKQESNRNLRKAQKLLRLGTHYGSERLEAVSQQALDYEVNTIRFFEGALAQQPQEKPVKKVPAPGFVRDANYFKQGEVSCNTI